jgi:Type IV secretion system pilin
MLILEFSIINNMSMKNKILCKKILCWFVSVLLIFPMANALAATQTYTPLQPGAFPGVTENTADLGVFLGSVFNWGIAIAVALALIMIIYGGIEMMTSDSWMKHDDGKKKIYDALMGLGLALISWLLLYIINPTLVTFCGNIFIGKSC